VCLSVPSIESVRKYYGTQTIISDSRELSSPFVYFCPMLVIIDNTFLFHPCPHFILVVGTMAIHPRVGYGSAARRSTASCASCAVSSRAARFQGRKDRYSSRQLTISLNRTNRISSVSLYSCTHFDGMSLFPLGSVDMP
jgi:hypothetical protein